MSTGYTELLNCLRSGDLDTHFTTLYPAENIAEQKNRYISLLTLLEKDHPNGQPTFINAPGRTELGGNHTDHNHGCVLAAAVDRDCVAAVTPIEQDEIILHSEVFPSPICVDLQDLNPHTEEYGTPQGLIRGVAAGIKKLGLPVRGFYGRLHSTCQPGTGLSSSAAFSLCIGAALTSLDNSFSLSSMELAIIAQEAENDFFGKPCGLMDQVACSVGKTVFIDFCNTKKPDVEIIDFSFKHNDHHLVVINTGGDHTDLTSEYASIPQEMKDAARALGKPYGRAVAKNDFLTNISTIRLIAGDRAALRLLHFIEENERAQTMADNLKTGAFNDYLQNAADSGKSSCQLLQNCSTQTNSTQQGILLALAISERISTNTVCRVHGGGFAGTVQAYVPASDFKNYRLRMEQIFGKGSVIPLYIGRPGICSLHKEGLTVPERG